jgi:ligand-binding sensor domain-containing protein
MQNLGGPNVDIWRSYTNGNRVSDLAIEGNTLWAATEGGVVRWDRTAGTYVKYTTADGLANNSVLAVAVDGIGHKWFAT